jgi:hypothetical protein
MTRTGLDNFDSHSIVFLLTKSTRDICFHLNYIHSHETQSACDLLGGVKYLEVQPLNQHKSQGIVIETSLN